MNAEIADRPQVQVKISVFTTVHRDEGRVLYCFEIGRECSRFPSLWLMLESLTTKLKRLALQRYDGLLSTVSLLRKPRWLVPGNCVDPKVFVDLLSDEEYVEVEEALRTFLGNQSSPLRKKHHRR